jgi:hypothetical protein
MGGYLFGINYNQGHKESDWIQLKYCPLEGQEIMHNFIDREPEKNAAINLI